MRRFIPYILFLVVLSASFTFAADGRHSVVEAGPCCVAMRAVFSEPERITPSVQPAVFDSRIHSPQIQAIADAPAFVVNIRHAPHPDHTRIVIDLSRPLLYGLAWVSETTLAVDLSPAVLGVTLQEKRILSIQDKFLKKIEIKKGKRNEIILLIDFKSSGEYKVFTLPNPDRLVIDVFLPKPEDGVVADLKRGDSTILIQPPFEIKTIVIDPGHGGKDPGASSRRGLREKDIVLDVALRLKTLLQRELKKKVIMTRSEDVFVSLKDRTELANRKKADLFISIHVNAAPKQHVKGIEIYLLGRATDEGAIATAARENATSEAAALNFQELILNDLERDFTSNASLELAHHTQEALIKHLIPRYPTTALGVKQAPFFVLAHTDMPAILAEISFLSNKIEEKRLRTKRYRQQVAEALYTGIKAYIQSLKTGF